MIQPNLTRQIFSLQITPLHSKRTRQKAEHNNWSGHLFNILYIYERERRHWFQREDRGWGHQRDIQYHLVSHAIPGIVTLARCYQFACRTMNGIGCERNNAWNSGKEAKDRVKKKKTNDIYIYIARGGTGYRFRDRKCKTYTNAERERGGGVENGRVHVYGTMWQVAHNVGTGWSRNEGIIRQRVGCIRSLKGEQHPDN